MGGGQSTSRNISNMIVNDQQTLLSEIVNNATASAIQTFGVNISNVKGDVSFSGNTVTQQASVDLTAAFDTSSSDASQETLAKAVSSSAKSLTSGLLNYGSSESVNETNTYINTSSLISSQIRNECYANTSQSQSITISDVGGSVKVDNNSFNQLASSMASCFATSVNRNEAVKNIQESVSQAAQSSALGANINLSFLIVIALVAVGGGVPILLALRTLIVFAVIIIAGAGIMAAGYLFFSPTVIATNEYSRLVKNTCPETIILASNESNSSIASAVAQCKNTRGCKAFDFIGYDLSEDKKSIAAYRNPPQTILYKQKPTCTEVFTVQDKLEIAYLPSYASGPADPVSPTATPGAIVKPNIWLNTLTSEWFILNQQTLKWESSGKFSQSFNLESSPAMWGPATNPGVIVATSGIKSNPTSFDLVLGTVKKTHTGPGFLKNIPTAINSSGYSYVKYNWLIMGAGAAVAGMGFLGLMYSLTMKPSKKVVNQNISPESGETGSSGTGSSGTGSSGTGSSGINLKGLLNLDKLKKKK